MSEIIEICEVCEDGLPDNFEITICKGCESELVQAMNSPVVRVLRDPKDDIRAVFQEIADAYIAECEKQADQFWIDADRDDFVQRYKTKTKEWKDRLEDLFSGKQV